MQVGLAVLGEVEVDNHIDGLDIDTTCEEVGADEVAAHAVAEVVENPVTMRLEHLGMRVETGVAELGDLFGEELNTICAVAKDDGLVDLELGVV